MHFCQDELFVLLMAIQNGPRNIVRYVFGLFKSFVPAADHWLDADMRSWRQSKRDMTSLKFDKVQKRWTHAMDEDSAGRR